MTQTEQSFSSTHVCGFWKFLVERCLMSKIEFKCHKCGNRLKSHKDNIGKAGTCPKCKVVNIVPENEDLVAQVINLLNSEDSGISKDWVIK